MIPGLQELISLVPDTVSAFGDTEFPFPISQAFFGEPPDVTRLRHGAAELEATWAEPQEAAWVALAAAEAAEATRRDVGWRCGSDADFHTLIFGDIKRRSGWVLLMGAHQGVYAVELEEAGYTTLVTRPGLRAGTFIGARRTSGVCFGQILARYALLYGHVRPGQLYHLDLFVEEQRPVAVLCTGEMHPIESLICLSLMHLGVPGMVAGEFPWESFPRAEVASPKHAIGLLAALSSLDPRANSHAPDLHAAGIPDLHETTTAMQWVIGGTERSFLFADRGLCSEGIAVLDEPVSDIGIVITVDDDTLDPRGRAQLEDDAVQCLDALPGLRVRSRHPLAIAVGDASPAGDEIAEAIRHGLRRLHTRLGPLNVAVIGDALRLATLAEKAALLRAQRAQEIGAGIAAG